MDRHRDVPVRTPALRLCRALREAGGRPFLVGGCVRDMVLGRAPKDYDVEVYGLEPDVVRRAVAPLGRFAEVGKSFGVLKLRLDGEELDVALPRTERKTGSGHRGFDVHVDPELPPEIASTRRDFTMNAMMLDPLENTLLDFHGGRRDLDRGVLRHVSPAFAEDPLRVLRGVQFAARFDLALDPDTAELCRALVGEADTLPASRIREEWRKWALAPRPGRGLAALEASGWLTCHPELAALVDCPQEPRWHPEGDVWTHTRLVVDEAARVADRHGWSAGSDAEERRLVLLFAALCHDLGKPETTRRDGRGRIRSTDHARRGAPLARSLLERLAQPRRLRRLVEPLVREHLVHLHGAPTDRAVRRLANRLEPADIVLWEALVEADASGRRPHPPSRPARGWLDRAEAMAQHTGRPAPLVTGRLLLDLGFEPGPEMGRLIRQAYEAQLDGEISDAASARAWCARQRGGR